MEISKNSWLYEVAYLTIKEENRPKMTNLCRFFWRIVLMLFIAWPALLIIWCVFVIIASIVGFLVGERLSFSKSDDLRKEYKSDILVPYEHQLTVGGKRILPIQLILALGSGWLVGCYGWSVAKLLYYSLLSVGRYWLMDRLSVIAEFFIGIVGIIFLWWLVYKLYNFEFVHFAKEYISARKQKICPIIRFTE